jgi:hypothetical protein
VALRALPLRLWVVRFGWVDLVGLLWWVCFAGTLHCSRLVFAAFEDEFARRQRFRGARRPPYRFRRYCFLPVGDFVLSDFCLLRALRFSCFVSSHERRRRLPPPTETTRAYALRLRVLAGGGTAGGLKRPFHGHLQRARNTSKRFRHTLAAKGVRGVR